MSIHALVPRLFGRGNRPLPATESWSPWSDFERLFDELAGDFGLGAAPALREFSPRIDVVETDDELRVSAELPGLEEKDFEVVLENDVLTLKGEKRSERDEERGGLRHVETSSGSFRRAFRLPFEVDPDAVKAAYKHGVLTVTVAKPVQAKSQTRTIPVTRS